MKNIERLFRVIEHNLATTNGTLGYARVTSAIIRLCEELERTETDEFVWSIGEFGEFTLGDLITGAYWHYANWHAGQASKEYTALSALGGIFSPGMATGPEEKSGEFSAYELLEQTAA